MVRFLVWIPLALWVGLSAAFVADVSIWGQPSSLDLAVITVGSFAFYFYIAYWALWKMNRAKQLRRVALAAVLTLTPFVVLVALDLAGVEGPTIVHAMTVPNYLRWWEPGLWVRTLVERAATRNPRVRDEFGPVPDLVSVRGGMQQPDGSMILYGITAPARDSYIWETWKLLGRLDSGGNLDESFVPISLKERFIHVSPQPDGTTLAVTSGVIPSEGFSLLALSRNGSLTRIARFDHTSDSTDEDPHVKITLEGPRFPARFLPGWAALVRVLPDGKQDHAFNAEAAKAIRHADLGDFRYAASEDQSGNTIVVLNGGLIRLNASGKLASSEVARFDRSRSGVDAFVGPSGLAIAPDGSIYVPSGSEHESEMVPHLLRFGPDLKEDRAFADAASSLAKTGGGAFHVLGFRSDGTVMVSLVNEKQGTRILFLNSKGGVIREVGFKVPPSPQSNAPQ